MIINIIIKAWLWKKISCSVMGEAVSCSLRFNHVVIFQIKDTKLCVWSLNPIHLSATLVFNC